MGTMSPQTSCPTGTYNSPLTSHDRVADAVETLRILSDQRVAGQEKTLDLHGVIAHIHGLGYHLVLARDLPRGSRP